MFSFTLSAQESKPPKYEKEGDLTKVVFFHDNGAPAQTGYFKDKNGSIYRRGAGCSS